MSQNDAVDLKTVTEFRSDASNSIDGLFHEAVRLWAEHAPDAAIENYSLIIALPGASADQVARARVNRAKIHRERGRYELARSDYTEVIEGPGVSEVYRMAALAGRGCLFQKLDDRSRALDDYSLVIEAENSACEDVAFALLNRGQIRGEDGRIKAAIGDFSRILALEGASAALRASALNHRAYWYGKCKDWPVEIKDATTVIEMAAQAPVSEVMQARLARGSCYARLNQFGKAWRDLTCVLRSPSATQYQIIFARFKRILLYGFGGYYSAALADCDQLLKDASVPVEMRVKAYLLKVLLFLRARLTRRS